MLSRHRKLTHCPLVPMLELKKMTKGTFFRAEQYAALSSFRVGKMQILYKRVGFLGRNGKKKKKKLIVQSSQN